MAARTQTSLNDLGQHLNTAVMHPKLVLEKQKEHKNKDNHANQLSSKLSIDADYLICVPSDAYFAETSSLDALQKKFMREPLKTIQTLDQIQSFK